MRLWIAIAITLMLAGQAVAMDYYVDSRQGDDANTGASAAQAWKSLERVNAQAFKPGDRILFKSGAGFTGQLKLSGTGSLVNGAPRPIVIERYGSGPLPRIDGAGVMPATVVLENAEYITLQNLEITNLGSERKPHRKGVYLHLDNFGTAHEVTLRNLYVHDVNGGLWKKDRGAGIEYKCEGKTKRSRFDGLLIENCRLERCDRNGIMGQGHEQRNAWFPSRRVVIRGNTLTDIGGDVIVPIACDGCLVERNVVRDPGRCLRREQVACRGLEELEHSVILERRRVRDVDHHRGTFHHLGQTLSGERVDARVRRRRHGLVSVLGERADELRADQPCAADDNSLHEEPPVCHAGDQAGGSCIRPTTACICDTDQRCHMLAICSV
jgi:hypothetical protein